MTSRKVLMVCSGNTCRSPLAAAMLAARVAADPRLRDVIVTSAGTTAWPGSPISEGSLLVGLERGLDLSIHRARLLTADDVRDASLILTMSKAHLERVLVLGGGAKAHTLRGYAENRANAADVPDPFGSDVSAYRRTADVFATLLDGVVERLAQESGTTA